MKILVISDIHSNFNALRAVMTLANELNTDLKICLGDMVGYYNHPNEVLKLLKDEHFICIKGNHDKFVLDELEYKIENQEIYGVIKHKEIVTLDNIVFLKEALEDYLLVVDGLRLYFCHTVNQNFDIYLKSEDDYLRYESTINNFDFFFHGHTHIANKTILRNTIIINPGSVGQQRGKQKSPTFCVLDTLTRSCVFYNIEYDIQSYTNELTLQGYDKRLIDILKG